MSRMFSKEKAICPKCKKSFPNFNILLQHNTTHSENNRSLYNLQEYLLRENNYLNILILKAKREKAQHYQAGENWIQNRMKRKVGIYNPNAIPINSNL